MTRVDLTGSIPEPVSGMKDVKSSDVVYGTPYVQMDENENTAEEPWTTGIFDCHQNCGNAVTTAVLPYVTMGQIAEILDEGETSCAHVCFMHFLGLPVLCNPRLMCCRYRKKLRNKYNLVEEPCGDSTIHLFCGCCALCQEFRELKHRGLDPSLGWQGNLDLKHQDNQVNIPPQNQTMYK